MQSWLDRSNDARGMRVNVNFLRVHESFLCTAFASERNLRGDLHRIDGPNARFNLLRGSIEPSKRNSVSTRRAKREFIGKDIFKTTNGLSVGSMISPCQRQIFCTERAQMYFRESKMFARVVDRGLIHFGSELSFGTVQKERCERRKEREENRDATNH